VWEALNNTEEQEGSFMPGSEEIKATEANQQLEAAIQSIQSKVNSLYLAKSRANLMVMSSIYDSLSKNNTQLSHLVQKLPPTDMSNCSGSSWRSRLGWSAGALDHVLSPHTGNFYLYITGECEALPFSTKSSHFTTTLPLLLNPSFLS